MTPSAKPLAVALAVLALTAGCVGPASIGDGSESVTSASPVDTATPTPDPDTATKADQSPTETKSVNTEGASNEPDPDKAVRLENAWNGSAEIRIRVVREATNGTVHEGAYTLDPGEEREVYNLADAEPDGIEPFRVIATARNTTDSVTVETHACHGDVYVELLEDGTVYPSYAIC
jgi:hypothetical protein